MAAALWTWMLTALLLGVHVPVLVTPQAPLSPLSGSIMSSPVMQSSGLLVPLSDAVAPQPVPPLFLRGNAVASEDAISVAQYAAAWHELGVGVQRAADDLRGVLERVTTAVDAVRDNRDAIAAASPWCLRVLLQALLPGRSAS